MMFEEIDLTTFYIGWALWDRNRRQRNQLLQFA